MDNIMIESLLIILKKKIKRSINNHMIIDFHIIFKEENKVRLYIQNMKWMRPSLIIIIHQEGQYVIINQINQGKKNENCVG